MRISLLLCGLLGILPGGTRVCAQHPSQAEVRRLPETAASRSRCLGAEFLLLTPELAGSQSKLPLLIFLHGSGGGGGDIRRIAGQPAAILRSIIRFGHDPCLVVAPQCRRQSATGEPCTWIPADLDLLLAHLRNTLPINASRIYLTGNSMGGYGSWAWAAESPEHFAAIAPVVGGIGPKGPKDITPHLDHWVEGLRKVPIWAFTGARDRVVPPEHPERIIRALQAKGHRNARITIYPDMGHDAGRRAYETAEFYQWLFSQKRH